MVELDLDEVRRTALSYAVGLHRDAGTFDGTSDGNRRVTDTADTITAWLVRNPVQEALEHRITQLEAAMTSMEGRMDDTAAAIADLNVATDELAARIDAVIDTADAQTAAALQPIADRLRTLASDTTQPVPPEEPTPEQPV